MRLTGPALWAALVVTLGCPREEAAPAPVGPPSPPAATSAPSADAGLGEDALVDELLAFEERTRATTHFAAQRPWSALAGSDPWKLEEVGEELAILWRGDGAITLGPGRVVHVPRGARDLRAREGALLTAAEDTLVLWRPAGIERLVIPGALELSSADAGPGLVHRYAVDALQDRLYVVHQSGEVLARFPTCAGPEEVARAGRALLVRCLLDHQILRFDLDAAGLPAPGPRVLVQHDGPLWAMRAIPRDDELLLAVAGVEDAPLDRTIGSFGNVDSYLWLYRVDARGPRRAAALNLGAHEVITPRSIRARLDETGLTLLVVGNGGPAVARVTADLTLDQLSVDEAVPVAPGAVDLIERGGELILANPLLDRVVRAGGADLAVARAPDDVEVRVGEALFFTHLMAPPQSSEGKRSRFTCETCHFEGGIDGRVHHTGRGEVRVSTKPLRGLFNNRPHFSRALDESMAVMVHNEFRVAHANTAGDFMSGRALDDHPWLRDLGVTSDLDARALRRALMRFLMVFHHEPNPRARGRARFSDLEARGADLFEARCARCHSARLVADDAGTEVARDAWEAHLFGAGNLIFGRAGYEKTGVTPYVHEDGARVPSLRRVSRKRPLLTSGVASSLEEVLALVGEARDPSGLRAFFHAGAPAGSTRLSAAEREALLAFLELL